jgi:hypothetical protein
MTRWQPIETVPKDGTPVDLWVRGTITQREWRIADAMWDAGAPIDCWQDGCGRRFYPDRVTPLFWMRAPSGPSSSEPPAGIEADKTEMDQVYEQLEAFKKGYAIGCGRNIGLKAELDDVKEWASGLQSVIKMNKESMS